jgi:hypothetical protein
MSNARPGRRARRQTPRGRAIRFSAIKLLVDDATRSKHRRAAFTRCSGTAGAPKLASPN